MFFEGKPQLAFDDEDAAGACLKGKPQLMPLWSIWDWEGGSSACWTGGWNIMSWLVGMELGLELIQLHTVEVRFSGQSVRERFRYFERSQICVSQS